MRRVAGWLYIDSRVMRNTDSSASENARSGVIASAMPNGPRTSEHISNDGRGRTPLARDVDEMQIRARGLPCAKPVNIELEDGRETPAGVQRRDCDSASPILDVIFIDAQPVGCACRTDACPLQCPVKACGEGAPQAVIVGTTLEMTDAFTMTIHLVTALSNICFYAIRYRLFRPPVKFIRSS
jgi:hypothetical protein